MRPSTIGALLGHAFLPTRSNNQRPRILHPAGLSVLVAVFLLHNSLRGLLTSLPGFVLGFSSSVSSEEVVWLTNQERDQAGLPQLRVNPLLSQAAAAKAADMLRSDYWAHISPSGIDPWKFMRDAGYSYRYAGENLARDFADTQSVLGAWLASPSHRENILSSKYSEIGVAVVDGTLQGVETRLVVQMFAAPAAVPLAQAQTTPVTPQPAPQVETSQPVTTTVAQENQLTAGQSEATQPQPQFAGETTITRLTSQLEEERLISPTEVSQTVGVVLVALILGTLVVDWVIAHRRRSVRLVGRNWAHMTYLGVILLMLLQYAQGRIL